MILYFDIGDFQWCTFKKDNRKCEIGAKSPSKSEFDIEESCDDFDGRAEDFWVKYNMTPTTNSMHDLNFHSLLF